MASARFVVFISQFLYLVFHFSYITGVALSSGSAGSVMSSKPRSSGFMAFMNSPAFGMDLDTYSDSFMVVVLKASEPLFLETS